jgi:hypothetical protein
MTGVLPQMERLIEVLEGRWKCDVTYEPNPQMPNGATSVGWEEARVGPGRSSILFDTRADGEAGAFEGAGFITWNSVNSSYDLHWLSSASPEPGLFTGRWDGGNVVFDGHERVGGQRFVSRHSIINIRAEAFEYTVDMGSTADNLTRAITIQYARE